MQWEILPRVQLCLSAQKTKLKEIHVSRNFGQVMVSVASLGERTFSGRVPTFTKFSLACLLLSSGCMTGMKRAVQSKPTRGFGLLEGLSPTEEPEAGVFHLAL